MRYLTEASADGAERFALLEFAAGDSVRQFLEDAHTLKRWLDRVNAA